MKSMERIKILHLLSSLAPGGAETNLLSLLPHFDETRYEHAVAFGGGGELEKDFQRAGVRLVKLSQKPISLKSALEAPAILKVIKDYSPAIIHSHLDGPNIIGLMAKWVLKCKLVLHFHGFGIIPRKNLPGRAMNHYLWNGIAHIYRYCNHAIAICTFQLPFLKTLGFTNGKIALIPNGINYDDILLGMDKDKHDYYRFVNVARFFPQKDHDLLMRAFYSIVHEVPCARLVLVGDGPLRPDIEKQAKALGIDDKVTFLGVRKDIPQILADCDCFVLPSLWELHPITILEAMRAGLPVIASDVGGVADTVADGVSGFLVKAGDEQSLTKAMIRLASEPELGRRMGTEGFRMVKEQFSNSLVAQKIESAYRTVLRYS
jgi:glycosyltransferase involved in cell wall biosynthesis